MILQRPILHPVGYRVLIFDADDTLRRCTIPGQPCPHQPGEWRVLPNVIETLSRYGWKTSHLFGLASNQGGIALGFLNEETAQALLYALAIAVTGKAWPMRVLQLCPHAPKAGCSCRKPYGLMLSIIETYWLSQELLHGPGECLYIGDQESDFQSAEHVGMDFCYAKDFFSWDLLI